MRGLTMADACRACPGASCARATRAPAAPDRKRKEESVSAPSATRDTLPFEFFCSLLTCIFCFLNSSFGAAREPLAARAGEELEPLLRHQAVVRLGHVYAVETQEAPAVRRGREQRPDLDDLDARLARGARGALARPRLRDALRVVYVVEHESLDARRPESLAHLFERRVVLFGARHDDEQNLVRLP